MSLSLAQKGYRVAALGAALLAAVLVLLVPSCGPTSGDRGRRIPPERIALLAALEAPGAAMLRQVYAARGFQPIWMDDQTQLAGARQLVRQLETSGADGLTPARYDPQTLGKRLDAAARAPLHERMRTELLLTATYVEYVRDLHTPVVGGDLAYTDRDLQPPLRDRAEIARQLARAPRPQIAIEDATRMNGIYVRMRDALARQRSIMPRDEAAETRLLLNLDRLRALPSELGDRFVLVDVAANRLWLYEDSQPVDSMKVVVGAPDGQTPQMAALIRYAVYNPFWNVPPDLTRDIYAPRIAANLSALADLRMNAWSGFTESAVVLKPQTVDWTAVASGQAVGWLRQRPGPDNSMGAVKFMLPNALGIYLHDSPHRELFDKQQRFFSAGCIRVEDYRRLSRWLFKGAEIAAIGVSAEQHFDLPAPVPVYIVYLTASAESGAVQVRPDVYDRDRAWVAAPPSAPVAPTEPVLRPSPSPPPSPATFERSPEAAAPAVPRPAPSPQIAPVPTPVPVVPVAKVRPALPAAAPVPPAAPAVAQRPAPAPRVAAPAVPRPAPSPQIAAVPVAKVRPALPAAAPVPPAAPAVAQRRAPAPAPAPAPARAAGACRIQVGVFSQRANADKLVNGMKSLGDWRLTEARSNGNVLYIVALGLPNRREAESALAKLNSSGKLGALRITGCPAAAD